MSSGAVIARKSNPPAGCDAALIGRLLLSNRLEDIETLLRLISERANPENRKALQRAARALFQQPPGRPSMFAQRDRRDIAEAERLLADGQAKSFHAASIMVAEKYHGDERAVRSISERLRRIRSQKKPST